MSSISPSDKARSNDEVRQAREENQAEEVATAKRNKAEKKRLQELHAQEIERMEADFDTQVDTLRNKHRSSMSESDERHQSQIDKIKNLYMEQNRKKSEEHETQRNELRRSLESELDSTKKVGSQQREVLTGNFKNSLSERDKEFENYQADTQKIMRKAIDDRGDKIKERAGKEVKAVTTDRDEKVAQLTKDRRIIKDQLTGEIKDIKEKSSRELRDKTEHWVEQSKMDSRSHEVALSSQNEQLKQERDRMRGTFKNIIGEKGEEMQKSQELLREQVSNRIDNQVKSLSYDLRKAKEDRIVDGLSDARTRALDRKNLMQETMTQSKMLEDDREKMIEDSNNLLHERVDSAVTNANKIVHQQSNRERLDKSVMLRQSREDHATLEEQMKRQKELADGQIEKRTTRLLGATNEELQTQSKFHEQNLQAVKSNYVTNLSTQRDAQFEVQQKQRIDAEQRLHAQGLKAEKKLEDTVANYELKIEKLREDFKAEKSRLVSTYEQRMSQREKQAKTEQEAQAMKFETKIAQTDEQREKEVNRLERRHQEQLADFSNRVKYINKKA